ncbi:glycosyltransferase family 49 protein [Crepidotus variabilis]|uniref:Glycosyltransferase family 49 protein n=1 Tax=Crepidotus variabilis TaxID=179855 RepID=A0A9P6ECY4_9AGAR|nr:glycosyltransferase family 49 protein [Crepidotus variabilis]
MLTKAFAGSMRPSNIIPYFYRAQGAMDEEQVTVATLITSNRFEVFERLVEKYQGPVSVTVHIKDMGEHVQVVLDTLHKMYTSSPLVATYVDVHLVVDNFDRQFNTWRNIARMFARTQYIMMLDIDFYPCTDFRNLLKQGRNPDSPVNQTMLEMVRDGRAALVIPAFEYRDFEAGRRYRDFPTKKTGLLPLTKNKKITMFHASWGPGHNSSDYDRFYTSPPGEIYKVIQYQSAYEPYVIFKRDGPPVCDERFVGYGGNKAACLFEMYLAGVSYYVLADHFMIHQNHLYEETARRNERNHNRKVYADFKEETCIRCVT